MGRVHTEFAEDVFAVGGDLPVQNVAAAALLANLKLVASVEATGLDYVCLAGLQQLCLML